MELLKTTTPAENDSVQAFHDQVAKDRVLFVVLGSGPEAESLVESADLLAGRPDDPRWVFWAKSPAVLQAAIAGLPLAEGIAAPDLTTPDRAFVVSFSNIICDVIRAGDPAPDPTRVFQAYNNGN